MKLSAQNTNYPKWLDRIEYPFESHYAELPIGKMHYVDEGNGDPIVMVHGNPGWSFEFRNVIKELSKTLRCIAPDHIGFGLSDKPYEWDYLPKSHAKNFEIFMDSLNLKNITLVVNDWGGPIGMGALSLSPGLLKGAVLLNTGFNAPTMNIDLSPAHATVKTPIIGELILEVFFSIFERLGGVQGDPESWTPEVAELYGKPLFDNGNAKAPLAMMRMVTDGPNHPSTPAMIQIEEYVKTLDIPSEIVWGMKDPILGKALTRMQQNFPDAPVIQTDAGHFLQEEVPIEIANALIRVIDKVNKE